MRNDNARWDVPHTGDAGLTLTWQDLGAQMLVSGTTVLSEMGPMVDWPTPAEGTRYAVCLRRDRVMCVGDFGLEPGFDPARGLAVTDVSDGYAVLDVQGPGALDALQRGGELRLDTPSRSAARRLFGVDVVLYRYRAEDRYRIHVQRGYAQALRSHLSQAH
ncbi:MAG: hypothetical protein ACU0DW_06025 [Shimia sp.]